MFPSNAICQKNNLLSNFLSVNKAQTVLLQTPTLFVPELVDSWEDGDGSVPDVSGVVHLPALHLHLGVLEP